MLISNSVANRFNLCFDLNTGFAHFFLNLLTSGSTDKHTSLNSSVRECCPTEPSVRYARFEHRICSD